MPIFLVFRGSCSAPERTFPSYDNANILDVLQVPNSRIVFSRNGGINTTLTRTSKKHTGIHFAKLIQVAMPSSIPQSYFPFSNVVEQAALSKERNADTPGPTLERSGASQSRQKMGTSKPSLPLLGTQVACVGYTGHRPLRRTSPLQQGVGKHRIFSSKPQNGRKCWEIRTTYRGRPQNLACEPSGNYHIVVTFRSRRAAFTLERISCSRKMIFAHLPG